MIKKLLFTSLLLLSSSILFAADAEKKEEAKKNSLVVYAGPHFSMASISGGGINPSAKISYMAGLAYERNFKGDFGVVAGLEFTEKGTNDFLFLDGRTDDYTLQYLQLNLAIKYSKAFWGMKGFGQFGPYVAYGIGGESKINGFELDGGSFDEISVDNGNIYTNGGAGFGKFDAGIRVAIGVEFYNVRITAGYQRGFVNIADSNLISNKYRNQGVFVTAGYAFKF